MDAFKGGSRQATAWAEKPTLASQKGCHSSGRETHQPWSGEVGAGHTGPREPVAALCVPVKTEVGPTAGSCDGCCSRLGHSHFAVIEEHAVHLLYGLVSSLLRLKVDKGITLRAVLITHHLSKTRQTLNTSGQSAKSKTTNHTQWDFSKMLLHPCPPGEQQGPKSTLQCDTQHRSFTCTG